MSSPREHNCDHCRFNILGATLREYGDKAGSDAAFYRALEIDPGFAEAGMNLVENDIGQASQTQSVSVVFAHRATHLPTGTTYWQARLIPLRTLDIQAAPAPMSAVKPARTCDWAQSRRSCGHSAGADVSL